MFKAFTSPLPPAELLAKVQSLSDPDEVDPVSRTFFPGSQPVVGRVAANRFVWQRRPAQRWALWLLNPACWFRPFLTGTVRPRERGSELQLEGGAAITAKVIWAVAFLGVAAVGALLTVFTYPVNISFAPAHSAVYFATGLVVTGLLQGLLLLPPAIGWLLTRNDLRFMSERLEQQLPLKQIGYRELAPDY